MAEAQGTLPRSRGAGGANGRRRVRPLRRQLGLGGRPGLRHNIRIEPRLKRQTVSRVSGPCALRAGAHIHYVLSRGVDYEVSQRRSPGWSRGLTPDPGRWSLAWWAYSYSEVALT